MPKASPAPASATPLDRLTLREAQDEHQALGREIAGHDKRYYEQDAPTVSDAEYDALRQRYEALEAQFPELGGDDSLTARSAPRRRRNSPRCATARRCCRSATPSRTRM